MVGLTVSSNEDDKKQDEQAAMRTPILNENKSPNEEPKAPLLPKKFKYKINLTQYTGSFSEQNHALAQTTQPSDYTTLNDAQAYNQTLNKISRLGKEKLSWWSALAEHHGPIEPQELTPLFELFTTQFNKIEALGLQIEEIDHIREAGSIPDTLNKIVALLNKSNLRPGDMAIQWNCIHKVDFSEIDHYNFIIPEMKLGTTPVIKDLKSFKSLFKKELPYTLDDIRPAFYRYVTTQKYRLSLADYELLFHELSQNDQLNNSTKLGLACILAETSSTNLELPFDSSAVLAEWASFKDRLVKLEYMERIANTLTGWAKTGFIIGTRGQEHETRFRILEPLLKMKPTPLLVYLNKLLKATEFDFLNDGLSIADMIGMQGVMIGNMKQSSAKYIENPETALKACRFINTQTVKQNAQGRYIPAVRDKDLLNKFNNTATILTEINFESNELHPKNTLYPLLTTFGLEYESQEDIRSLLVRYSGRVEQIKNHREQLDLFAYGLWILQSMQMRTLATPRTELKAQDLDTIQNEILRLAQIPAKSKKDIRAWMNERYGRYFQGSSILTRDDSKAVIEYLKSIDCLPEQMEPIGRFMSYLDLNAEEQNKLAQSLSELAKVLNTSQFNQFINFYIDDLDKNAQSYKDQNKCSDYRRDFSTLVDVLKSRGYFDEWKRFIYIKQESSQHHKGILDALKQSSFLLANFYPMLLEQKIEKAAAFNFAAGLVAQHSSANLEEYCNGYKTMLDKMANVSEAISVFNAKPQKSAADLEELKKPINELIGICPEEPNFLTQCRTIVTHIDDAIQSINSKNQWDLGTVLSKAMNLFSKEQVVASEDDLKFLSSARLLTLVKGNLSTNQQIRSKVKGLNLYRLKSDLLNKYPNISTRVDDFFSRALRDTPDDIAQKERNIKLLTDNLIALDDQNLVLSLMYHFCGGCYGDVADLVALFKSSLWQGVADCPEMQKHFIHAVVSQMNNGVTLGKSNENILSVLTDVLYYYSKDKAHFSPRFKTFYQQAPFPSFERFFQWHKDYSHLQPALMDAVIQREYAAFDFNPCAHGADSSKGREEANGFKIKDAERIVFKIPAIKKQFDKDYLKRIEQESEHAKKESTDNLIKILKDLKKIEPINHVRLVMYCAELLHRTKGQAPEYDGFNKPIPGRSFELNTTQIISILTMLETGNQVTAEIKTGEGKSRIMMIMNACQYLKGKTVDFMTSNMDLAERDYLESLPFYSALGAKVNLIKASSKFEDYQIGGINFSDCEHLSLFRCKAMSQHQTDKVLDPDPSKRALLLDEADVAYYDLADIAYNNSSSTSEENIQLLALYPLLMDFFAASESDKNFESDRPLAKAQLLDSIESKNRNLSRYVESLAPEKLDRLMHAAYRARRLVFNKDYTIDSEAIISTPLGHTKVAAALPFIGPAAKENAEFGDAIHQCLHADLNRLMTLKKKNPYNKEITDPNLAGAIDSCIKKNRLFHIHPEYEIDFSLSLNRNLKFYSEGSMHAVTGTIGAKREQKEAHKRFNTEFIQIPLHKGMQRIDRPMRITQNKNSHYEALLEHILQSRKKNQPVIIFFNDDGKSKEFETWLKAVKSGLSPSIERIYATKAKEEQFSLEEYINNKGGMPGQITICTGMQGRGTDIKLKERSHQSGLKVVLADRPKSEREFHQMIGRSGRFGALGETQMVLNMEELKHELGINRYNPDFFRNPELYIRRLNIFNSYTKELHRLFNIVFDEHLAAFQKEYEKEEVLETIWPQFAEQYNLMKEQTDLSIKLQLEKIKPDSDTIRALLLTFQQETTTYWNSLLPEDQLKKEIPAQLEPPALLTEWLSAFETLRPDEQFISIKEKMTVKIHEHYDASAAGQVRIVKNVPLLGNWTANLMAKLKGEGLLFPNLSAWLAGQLSFRNLISQIPIINWVIKPIEEEREIQIQVPSSYAEIYKRSMELGVSVEENSSIPNVVNPTGQTTPLFNRTSGLATPAGLEHSTPNPRALATQL